MLYYEILATFRHYYLHSNTIHSMVDAATKKTLAAIPLLKTKAGPRDKEEWPMRLKEEVTSLIKVQSPKQSVFELKIVNFSGLIS